MKLLIALLASTIFSGVCYAKCTPGAEAAKSFINEYIQSSEASENRSQWVQRNTRITDAFISSYQALLDSVGDEEGGLDFDPILNAQDYPDRGFGIVNCAEQGEYITLQGVDQSNFTVVVKIKKSGNVWLIDGAGIINVPETKRAH